MIALRNCVAIALIPVTLAWIGFASLVDTAVGSAGAAVSFYAIARLLTAEGEVS